MRSGPATGIIAIDCEMVGVGTYGERSALARCSIVNVRGETVYDKHVKPIEKVSDYRTLVSGVTAQDLHHAVPFKQAQQEIADIIKDRTLVGHGLSNDFEVYLTL